MATQVVDPSASTWEAASTHRTPGIDIKPLLQRDGEGRSFEFNVVRFGGEDFWSPRHRHNFDQIRIGLEGETQYGPHRKLPARTIGYYPEGTYYGPLSVSGGPSLQAILQFDGAGRGGYVNYVHLDKATAELKELGEFRKGFWHPHDGGKAVDGYQASWERATGREMIYPEPRFDEAVYMHVDAFSWVPVDGSPVRSKHLGSFGERGLSIGMHLVPAGASLTIGAPGRSTVAFVLTGEVRAGGAGVGQHSALFAEDEDAVEVRGAADDSELVVITLPTFD
ncbi:hypothetical protein [Micromonospora sp. NPDC047074]|uniref:hypothetical protein n=1 Tax=Micromonospora sp. NPDC047074 TaxID=3154339 RepID=UPI0033E1C0E2